MIVGTGAVRNVRHDAPNVLSVGTSIRDLLLRTAHTGRRYHLHGFGNLGGVLDAPNAALDFSL
jgi:hypothetical protein